MAAFVAGVSCSDSVVEAPTTYTVVRGDTLSAIGQRHGVTAADLMAWNSLSSDRIEVGLVLTIERSGVAVDASSVPVLKHPPRSRQSRGQDERRPKPQACLHGPSLDDLDNDDVDIQGSVGLSMDQLRASMNPAMAKMGACIDGPWPSATVRTEVTVGCNGLVQQVHVIDAGGLGAELVDCLSATLQRQGFPAHDMPDGFTFQYPITLSP